MWTEENWYNEAKKWAQENNDFIQKMCKRFISILKEPIPDKEESEIINLVFQHSQKRLNAPVDLRKYPELRGMKQLISAQWKGIGDGAGIDEKHVAIYTNGLYFYHRMICTGKIGNMGLAASTQGAKCSYIFFPESDHGRFSQTILTQALKNHLERLNGLH